MSEDEKRWIVCSELTNLIGRVFEQPQTDLITLLPTIRRDWIDFTEAGIALLLNEYASGQYTTTYETLPVENDWRIVAAYLIAQQYADAKSLTGDLKYTIGELCMHFNGWTQVKSDECLFDILAEFYAVYGHNPELHVRRMKDIIKFRLTPMANARLLVGDFWQLVVTHADNLPTFKWLLLQYKIKASTQAKPKEALRQYDLLVLQHREALMKELEQQSVVTAAAHNIMTDQIAKL